MLTSLPGPASTLSPVSSLLSNCEHRFQTAKTGRHSRVGLQPQSQEVNGQKNVTGAPCSRGVRAGSHCLQGFSHAPAGLCGRDQPVPAHATGSVAQECGACVQCRPMWQGKVTSVRPALDRLWRGPGCPSRLPLRLPGLPQFTTPAPRWERGALAC